MRDISICQTFRNRAPFLKRHFESILRQDYDHKKISFVIADGNSDDGVLDLVKEYYSRFKKIIYFISDRDVLPFKVPFNNPSVDYNMSVLSAEDDLIIRTDPEIIFPNKNTLQYISEKHGANKDGLIHCNATKVTDEFDSYNEDHLNNVIKYTSESRVGLHTDCAMCMSFSKSTFVDKAGGFDERFAKGFCAEDSYLSHWFRVNLRFLQSPDEYFVVHLNHGLEHYNKEAENARWTYSIPLMRDMQARNERANLNVDWKRFDMIKNKMEFCNE